MGDSLVGLTREQIEAAHWDLSKDSAPLLRGLLRERVNEVAIGRRDIQFAPDDVSRSIQEARHRIVEKKLEGPRLYGDAIIAAFFSEDRPRKREEKRVSVAKLLTGLANEANRTAGLMAIAETLQRGERSIRPFHWELEFPEVFARDNPGFNAIVGNPPFLGGKSISTNLGTAFSVWLEQSHPGGSRSADLVAHFFRRAFGLLRYRGVLGLIATNTIGQGDTRDTGLSAILTEGGSICRAVRRLEWPGEAAVIVSVVHISKGSSENPVLDNRAVDRISAYLVEGTLDQAPKRLVANARKTFIGSFLLGMGFTFDDVAAAKGETETINTMRTLVEKNQRNAERIFPFIGGEEVSTSPTHAHHRYVINFFDLPLCRDASLRSWAKMSEQDRARCGVSGSVPSDYPDEVAEDWPDLLEIVRRRVKPERDPQKRDAVRTRWWQFADKRPGLYRVIRHLSLDHVFVANAGASPHMAIARLPVGMVYSHALAVITLPSLGSFAALQARTHEIWARFFSSSMKDDLRYAPSDCLETFPFPINDAKLEEVGQSYIDHRTEVMVARNEGMTRIYNRFHEVTESAPDIQRLRELHAEMDREILRSYGWDDLADRANPVFLNTENEDNHTYQDRLFWPSVFRDEVLARLMSLNAQRHSDEVSLGVLGQSGMFTEIDGDESDETNLEQL
jgi:hypothetical protein